MMISGKNLIVLPIIVPVVGQGFVWEAGVRN